MNRVENYGQREIMRHLAVYGILPALCLVLALGIVALQFVVSRTVYPEGTLPLYRSLAAVHRAYSKPVAETEEFLASHVAKIDLPTDALAVLPELPKGVYPIVRTTIALGSGLINATDYSADISVMASAVPQSAAVGPTVLVYHTHTTESFYEPQNAPVSGIVAGQSADVFGYYEEGLSPRSEDAEKNMIAVGRAFCAVLEENGVSAVHCETVHDLNYSEAYGNSLKSVKQYLQDYPSIKYIIDLHRDSLVRDNGTKLKPTCTVNGESVAQVMLVVGAGSEGLSQKNWRENLGTASRLQSYFYKVADGFARPVYLRYGRFNQQLSECAMLLEVGSCGNTLEEAVRAAEYAGEALAQMILDA